MKKYLLLIIILFFTSCNNTTDIQETKIIYKENLTIDVYSKTNLYSLLSIENGKILTEDFNVDTTMLGNQNISFDYKDHNNKTNKEVFSIEIIDKIKPTIMSSSTYYIKTGETLDILDDIVCGDNYDRNPKCSISGDYNKNKAGEYKLKILIEDSSGNTNEKDIKLIIKDKYDNSNNSEKYNFSKLKELHKTKNTEVGIDVSTWQGDINWQKVKDAGAEFVMIRIGFGMNSDNKLVLDNKFKQNIKGAKKVGLKVGIYFYSYAKNEIEAKKQAQWIIETLDQEKIELPIAFDWEDWSDFNDYNINFYELNNIAKTFLTEIENAGYKSMLYSSASYLEKIWNLPEYNTWLAHYTDKTDYTKNYYIWQLSNKGKIDGIFGDVDLNVLYK